MDSHTWELVASGLEGLSYVVDNLLPDVAYVFSVSAVNEIGAGPSSQPTEPISIRMYDEYESDSPMSKMTQMKVSGLELEHETGVGDELEDGASVGRPIVQAEPPT